MNRNRERRIRAMVDLLGLLFAAGALVWLYHKGQDFYQLPVSARLDHPRYDELKSGGSVGRGLGTMAVVFFVLNLLYAARRRLRVLRKLGHLRSWMTAHMLFGLVGGGLIALHATFEMRSEAARYSAIAVMVLLATGIVGRYIYSLIPHTATGAEAPDGLHGRAESALAKVAELLGGDHPFVTLVRTTARLDRAPERKLLRAALRIPSEPFRRLFAAARIGRGLKRLAPELELDLAARLEIAAREAVHSGMAWQLAASTGRILRSWRNVHLLFALLMVWTAFVHIRSAYEVGQGWKLPDPLWPWLAAGLAPAVAVLLLEFAYRRKRRRPTVARPVRDGPPPSPPPTLHPSIDPNICMGSGSCVSACPEGDILSLLDGRSRLTEPGLCVGHGECYRSCPVQAITLVYGTHRRGVDIPEVSRYFESSVPGVYLIGELTGMGLIRNAVAQGTQAMAHVLRRRRRDSGPLPEGMLDICIVGAGPAGIAATLACIEAGLDHVLLEQEAGIGGAVNHYPRRKLVMTEPMELPTYGKVRKWEATKEELVELWADVQRKTGLKARGGVKVEKLVAHPAGGGFVVELAGGEPVLARRVLLAVGRRGTPRKLGVPGEEQPKVMYSLLEPDQFVGRRMTIVGGGDSALEAALSLAEAGAASIDLIYRRDRFDRAKQRNRDRLHEHVEAGRIILHLKANLAEIRPDSVVIKESGVVLPNDEVIVCVGGTLPTRLLRSAGVKVQQHFGRPL